jgi:hypothetical protein
MSYKSMGRGVCAVGLALALAGCAGPGGTAQPGAGAGRTSVVAPTPAAEPRCPRDGGPLALGAIDSSRVVAPPPAGFVPTRVIRCTLDRRPPNPGGSITTAGVRIRQESGPVTARLLAALGRHDQVAPPGSVYNCPAMGVLPPFFLLLADSTGATYRARIPVTVCEGTQQPVLDALAAIDWGTPSVFSSR